MKLTCVAPYVPHAAIAHAGGKFLGRHLASLAKVYEVTLIAPADLANLSAFGVGGLPRINVHLVPLPGRRPSTLGRAVAGLPRMPGGITPGAHVLRGFRDDDETWRIINASDIVEIQWGHLLPMVTPIRDRLPAVPLTAVAHDVLAQSLERRAVAALSRLDRTASRLRLPFVRFQEMTLLNRCDLVFVFSEKDAGILRKSGVRSQITVLDPPIDEVDGPTGPSGSDTILFVGALNRPENWESVVWFLNSVWDAVVAKVPRATFVIAGAEPQQALADRASRSRGVTVRGWVDDLDAEYRKASVVVAPLRSGAGVKFKVLEAMAHGLPVVATSVGAEGIPTEAANFGAISDDPAELAAALVALLLDPKRSASIGEVARQWVLKRYHPERAEQAVLDAYAMLAHLQ